MVKRLIGILGVLTLVFMVSMGMVAQDRQAPDFNLKSLEDSSYWLQDYRGQPVVVIFFTTWCPHCEQEMKYLEDFYQQMAADQGLMVFAINVQERIDVVRNKMANMGITYPVLLDETGRVARDYRMVALPTAYFINPSGDIQDMVIGAVSSRVLQTKLDEITWYQGLTDPEIETLINHVTDLRVLDFREERENPFSERDTVLYHEVRDLEVSLAHFAPQEVYLLLTEGYDQSQAIAREMARAGFSRIYYRLAHDREG